MKFKLDVAQTVFDARDVPIPGDQQTLGQDLMRLRVALTTIEQGTDDPEQVAADALAAVEGEPMQMRDLIEQTINNRKIKYVDDGRGGMMAVPDEPDPTEKGKTLAGRLNIKIHARDTIELSPAEVNFLEKRSGIVNGAVPHVRLLMALHPEREWDDDEEDDEDGDAAPDPADAADPDPA